MTAPVTLLYAAPLALLTMGLALTIVRERRRRRVGLGDGGDPAFTRLIRAHGNLTEVAPIALILLLLAELNGAPAPLLHGCGSALVTGRVLHAYGLSRHSGRSFGRFTGSALSWGAVIVLALTAPFLLLRA